MSDQPVYATITSKRQLTIPIAMYKKLGLKKGDNRVIVRASEGELKIKSAVEASMKALETLAGCVKPRPEDRGKDIVDIVHEGIKKYWEKRDYSQSL